jgi:hypothetical protein
MEAPNRLESPGEIESAHSTFIVFLPSRNSTHSIRCSSFRILLLPAHL